MPFCIHDRDNTWELPYETANAEGSNDMKYAQGYCKTNNMPIRIATRDLDLH
jgi:hypothetical protein